MRSLCCSREKSIVFSIRNLKVTRFCETALSAVITLDDITALKNEVQNVAVHPTVKKYIIDIVTATRESEFTILGASPRGSIALHTAAKALALINGRNYVVPDDVKALATEVLAHRLMLSPKGKSVYAVPEKAMAAILSAVPVPQVN